MSTSSGGQNRGANRNQAAFGARVRALDAKLGRRSAVGKASSGNALALIPLAVALLCAAVMLPRPATPRDIPLPVADERVLANAFALDHARAEAARHAQLPSSVRAVGTALRTFFTAQADDAEADTLLAARNAITQTLDVERSVSGAEPLLQLRALDTEEFLAEVAKSQRFDGSPPMRARFVSSPELEALSGPFSLRMNDAGFLVDGVVHLSTEELRILYRALWTAAIGLGDDPEFAPTLEENRVRFALLLRQGHPASREAEKLSAVPRLIARAGGGAELETEAQRCAREDRDARSLLATWRTEKVIELSRIDPAYPLGFALGILSYERGDYESSVKFFRAFEDEHPEGPYALRTANFLRAAMREAEAIR